MCIALSVAGTPASATELPTELKGQLKDLRTRTPLPLAVGFGISKPEQVNELRGLADGVIVGSAIVRQLEPLAKKEKSLDDVLSRTLASSPLKWLPQCIASFQQSGFRDQHFEFCDSSHRDPRNRKSFMYKLLTVSAAIGAMLILAAVLLMLDSQVSTTAAAQADKQKSAAPVEDDMHEFMEYVFEPTYLRLKEQMAVEKKDRPVWKKIKSDALILAEGGNLTLMRDANDSPEWAEYCASVRIRRRTLSGRQKERRRRRKQELHGHAGPMQRLPQKVRRRQAPAQAVTISSLGV